LLEQDNEKRLGLLRRTRAVHVAVAYAQRLIRVDNSGQTYSEQLRKLMTCCGASAGYNGGLGARTSKTTLKTRMIPPTVMTAVRAPRTRKCELIPTRNSTLAR